MRAKLGVPMLLLALAGGASCAGEPSVLDPAGETAQDLASLWWLMLVLGGAVWALVMVVLVRAVVMSRRGGRQSGFWSGAPLVAAGGLVLPAIVLVPLLVVVFSVAEGLSNEPAEGDLRIEVEGEQFWWRVTYPGSGAVTANEIHVPVGRPVTLVLTSRDVIHSFWVPNVAGKTDLIPGETTHLRFRVDRPGTYRGACAEFCGLQHAQMRILLVAQPAPEFERWAAATAEPAAEPRGALAEAGGRVFSAVGCASCHTVRGTSASGQTGPDLTHLAGRQTIGAGAAPNTRGHLAGWIVDAQGLKPGSEMPAQRLEPDQLEALLAYLEGLE